jgi:uncharacterized membrane protein
MLVFAVLAVVFAALLLLDALGLRPAWLRSHRAKMRLALAAMFLLAASGRLVNPDGLVQMIPDFLPLRREALYLSGLFELLGAIGLLVPRTRQLAGWGLITLMLVVFPANVNVALHNLQLPGIPASPLEQWVRLPLQLVLIGLTWWATRPGLAPQRTDRTVAPAPELARASR